MRQRNDSGRGRIGRLVLMLAAAFGLAAPMTAKISEAPVEAEPTPYFLDLSLVHLLRCDGVSGTGVRVEANLIATAAHVAAAMPCNINGVPLTIERIDEQADIALLRSPVASPRRVTISCSAPLAGARYFAVGWAAGSDFIVQPVVGTGGAERRQRPFVGAAQFRGSSWAGMSGGPILDGDGDVIAIVNAGRRDGRPLMLGRLLRDTFLCRNGS